MNQNHYSGAQGQATGMVSRNGSDYSTSIDTIIGEQIGRGTRFRSLEATCDGDSSASWSARGSSGLNPSETSPLALYARLFGEGFQDPNVADFKPDPAVMVRHSVLSAVSEQRGKLMSAVSASDRARLDEYFSSVRDLEQKLAFELDRAGAAARLHGAGGGIGADSDRSWSRSSAPTGSSRGFWRTRWRAARRGSSTSRWARAFSRLRRPGEVNAYHALTHEEPIDPELGYQPTCKWLGERMMDFFRELVQTLDGIREGRRHVAGSHGGLCVHRSRRGAHALHEALPDSHRRERRRAHEDGPARSGGGRRGDPRRVHDPAGARGW